MPAAVTPVFHQHRYAHELDRLVTRGCAWLDVGAGKKIHDGWTGVSCEDLASRPGFFAGCDLVEDVLDNPFLHESRIADAAALPWPDATFDVVSANMVVEHLEEPVAVFREVMRVLKPGGKFVFVTPNRKHPIIAIAAALLPPRMRRWFAVHVEGRSPEDVFVTAYRCNTVGSIGRMAAVAGFRVQTLECFVSFPILRGVPGRIEGLVEGWAARFRRGQDLGADILAVLKKPDPTNRTSPLADGRS